MRAGKTIGGYEIIFASADEYEEYRHRFQPMKDAKCIVDPIIQRRLADIWDQVEESFEPKKLTAFIPWRTDARPLGWPGTASSLRNTLNMGLIHT